VLNFSLAKGDEADFASDYNINKSLPFDRNRRGIFPNNSFCTLADEVWLQDVLLWLDAHDLHSVHYYL
jgi:hypothetical protein